MGKGVPLVLSGEGKRGKPRFCPGMEGYPLVLCVWAVHPVPVPGGIPPLVDRHTKSITFPCTTYAGVTCCVLHFTISKLRLS